MAKQTTPTQTDEIESFQVIRMRYHLILWSLGMVSHLLEDIKKEFDPSNLESRTCHQLELDKFSRQFKKSVDFLAASGCGAVDFKKWQLNTLRFSRDWALTIERCKRIRSNEAFLDLSSRFLTTSLDQLQKMKRELERQVAGKTKLILDPLSPPGTAQLSNPPPRQGGH